ncbi:MAG: hypothetical protein J7M18_02870 [Candidatus Eremiobacteraeota bacterium]|nr:hypothetical protein [Candidatus Eremiobacteraeota bacterium]
MTDSNDDLPDEHKNSEIFGSRETGSGENHPGENLETSGQIAPDTGSHYLLKNLSKLHEAMEKGQDLSMDLIVEGAPQKSSVNALGQSIIGLQELMAYACKGVEMPPEFREFIKTTKGQVGNYLVGLKNEDFLRRLEKINPDFHHFIIGLYGSLLKLYEGLDEMSLYLEDQDHQHIVVSVPVCQSALKQLGQIYMEAQQQAR